ncbi:MAG: N-acetylneuraminate synthase [Candidatus Scalindua sp.]|jgi:N-acetylneuraminate synthase|nr:N-acetylneuraminate synthase [Candidatus Scalindua sp.]
MQNVLKESFLNSLSNTRCYIIAEAGVNHNGSLEMARKLIDVAVEAGADAVKFQTFRAENLVSRIAPKAEYQMKTTNCTESQFEMIKKLQLGFDDYSSLIQCCQKKGIQFLATPFDLESVDLLSDTLDVPVIKLSSGDITNAPLLLKVAKTGKPVILSTGMSSLGEIEIALSVLAFGYVAPDKKFLMTNFQDIYFSEMGQEVLRKKVLLLHCTSEYPAPYGEVNLHAMDTLQKSFCLQVGLSDHTLGIAISIAAAALGAVVIEKHFTLSRKLSGPDHKASLEPHELKTMVESIRQVEEALGSPDKIPTPSELKNRPVFRKSLIASDDIKKGEIITGNKLVVKRPGSGISPINYWEYLGSTADRDYKQDEMIEK